MFRPARRQALSQRDRWRTGQTRQYLRRWLVILSDHQYGIQNEVRHHWRRAGSSLRRAILLFIVSATVLGSALEIFASERLSAHFESDRALCRWNLCDDHAILDYAYDLQIYGDKHELERASGILLESLVRDSSSAYRWIDFSQVLAQQGRLDQASYCMARAVDLGHESADVLDEAGSFYLLYGDPRVGLRDFARVLTMTRTYDEQIFNLFDTRKVTVEDALEYGIPVEKLPVQGYLRYLIEQRRTNQRGDGLETGEPTPPGGSSDRGRVLHLPFQARQFSQAATEWANAQWWTYPGLSPEEFPLQRRLFA